MTDDWWIWTVVILAEIVAAVVGLALGWWWANRKN